MFRREYGARGGYPHALRVDGEQIGVFEQFDQVRLSGFLTRRKGRRRPTQTRVEFLRNLAHKALQGKLADGELRALLGLSDLTKPDGSRTVSVGLLLLRQEQPWSSAPCAAPYRWRTVCFVRTMLVDEKRCAKYPYVICISIIVFRAPSLIHCVGDAWLCCFPIYTNLIFFFKRCNSVEA